jgi:hypothetical protein
MQRRDRDYGPRGAGEFRSSGGSPGLNVKRGISVITRLLLVSMALLLIGCYAATVETGLPPSNTVIKQPWSSCWIFGLVAPKTVETAAKCPNGVARVETQLSFVNQVVGIVTFGIYTPMQIVVTCAESASMGQVGVDVDFVVAASATDYDLQAAFTDAAELAVASRRPVFVQMGQ